MRTAAIIAGPQGKSGARGFQGTPGLRGSQGITIVPRAIPGPQGWYGKTGAQGRSGGFGFQGASGKPSERGDKGDNGYQGLRGEKGEPGNHGDKGEPGNNGDKGDPGNKGEPGNNGDKGLPGAQGNMGHFGDKGDKGDLGMQGHCGIPGQTTIVYLSGPQGPPGQQQQNGSCCGGGIYIPPRDSFYGKTFFSGLDRPFKLHFEVNDEFVGCMRSSMFTCQLTSPEAQFHLEDQDIIDTWRSCDILVTMSFAHDNSSSSSVVHFSRPNQNYQLALHSKLPLLEETCCIEVVFQPLSPFVKIVPVSVSHCQMLLH